ncbi:MAG: cation:proton antiporter [Opitutaceae bacterium]
MNLILIFLVLLFVHSLVSGRLERTIVTTPIAFAVVGMLTYFILPSPLDFRADHEVFLTVAEIGLVLLLFTDASRTGLRELMRIGALPGRLLSVGMLLTIVLGAIAAKLVFPALTIWEAGILAAILAPTDAGLGQVIVNSPRVPLKIREALNVEAGLNDGLSVPFLLFFIALADPSADGSQTRLVHFVVEQLGYGFLVGAGIGLVGGGLLGRAHRRKWIAHGWLQLGVVVLPVMCLLVSERVDASPFIAAFVAGLAVQVGFKDASKHSVEFTEQWGQVFNLAVFFLFGLLAAHALPELTWMHALYAVLSLTVVRMLPVAVALIRTRLSRSTVLFMGWFGPRGLASIVLGLVYLGQEMHQTGEGTIRLAVMLTVLCSILAHGATALPGTKLYARKVTTLSSDAPELGGVKDE